MSVSTFDFGDGMKYVECATYDEALDVIQFLLGEGYNTGIRSANRLAELIASRFPQVGVSGAGCITGWIRSNTRASYTMPYWDFCKRRRFCCAISNIDDLL